MISKWDIHFMEDSVRNIVNNWHDSITILSPLPLDKQPNYNKLMREYTGDIKFSKRVIPAERKDLVNNHTNNFDPSEIEYGERNAGVLMYSIPDVIPKYDDDGKQIGTEWFRPNQHDIFIVDESDDRYYLRSMRDRVGEVLIILYRYVGGTPNGIGTLEQLDEGGDPDEV